MTTAAPPGGLGLDQLGASLRASPSRALMLIEPFLEAGIVHARDGVILVPDPVVQGAFGVGRPSEVSA